MNRRNFLTLTGTFTGGLLVLPDFLHAFGSQNNLATGEQCIVFVQLNGGNDGLNTFIPYDNPPEDLVTYYGDYFRKVKFEIQPLLTKIFTEEYKKENSGTKIKNPLVYILQLLEELHRDDLDDTMIIFFLKQQGMYF